MEAARFNPTWQQALGRGLYHGVLASFVGGVLTILAWAAAAAPPIWWWPVSAVPPLLLGALAGRGLGPRRGIEMDAGGIRTATAFARGVRPRSRGVDARAGRGGAPAGVAV